MITLLALRAVKESGKGKAPPRAGFRVSGDTLLAVKKFVNSNDFPKGDPNNPAVFTMIVNKLEIYLLKPGSGCHLKKDELWQEVETDFRNEVLGPHVDWVLRDPNGMRKSRSVFHGSWEASYDKIMLMFVGVASLLLVDAAGISNPDAARAQQEEQSMTTTAVVLFHAMRANPDVKACLDSTKGAKAVEAVIK